MVRPSCESSEAVVIGFEADCCWAFAAGLAGKASSTRKRAAEMRAAEAIFIRV
jgi:hypothetical protein